MTSNPFVVLSALATASVVALLVRLVIPPQRSLVTRVMPYLNPSAAPSLPGSGGVLMRVFGPMIDRLASWVGRLTDSRPTESLILKLRQSGWYVGLSDLEMLTAQRLLRLRNVMVGTGAGIAVAWVIGLPWSSRLVVGLLGFIAGFTRMSGQMERAIQERTERMRVEIYTVNQLLAMRVRAGGGVVHAVQSVVDRGQGAVVEELSQALRLHRSGWRASDAFRRIAELTPEPFCSRTYRLLASAEERGSDLASSLLALSEDVRETRRESIRRSATRRRAAMLIPTIAILAPVLIVFVAAPLPYLITGWQ